MPLARITRATGVSVSAASRIRSGELIPASGAGNTSPDWLTDRRLVTASRRRQAIGLGQPEFGVLLLGMHSRTVTGVVRRPEQPRSGVRIRRVVRPRYCPGERRAIAALRRPKPSPPLAMIPLDAGVVDCRNEFLLLRDIRQRDRKGLEIGAVDRCQVGGLFRAFEKSTNGRQDHACRPRRTRAANAHDELAPEDMVLVHTPRDLVLPHRRTADQLTAVALAKQQITGV